MSTGLQKAKKWRRKTRSLQKSLKRLKREAHKRARRNQTGNYSINPRDII